MLGFLVTFWAAPTMASGHLLFSLGTTDYKLIALQLEERDLTAQLGERYRDYRRRVPRLIPNFRRVRRSEVAPRLSSDVQRDYYPSACR